MSNDIELTEDFSAPAAPENSNTPDINIHLGKRLRRRRRMMGMTQGQLAEVVGVRFQQIQKYECGANKINAERLWLLSGALGVPVGYFYEGLKAGPQICASFETAADKAVDNTPSPDPTHSNPTGLKPRQP